MSVYIEIKGLLQTATAPPFICSHRQNTAFSYIRCRIIASRRTDPQALFKKENSGIFYSVGFMPVSVQKEIFPVGFLRSL